MMKSAIIATFCIPVFTATGAYTADYASSRQQADVWQAEFSQLEEELKALGVDLQATGQSAELPETEDTVAVADKGLFFDTANSSLVYLGNVRLRDARARINASSQLHLYLPNLPSNRTKDAEPADTQETHDAPAAEPEQQPSPAPILEKENEDTPRIPAEPALINTHSAIADSVNNNIFLYSPAGGEEILLQQEKNVVRITPGADTPARILADPQGNIMLEGSLIDLCMVDKNGAESRLKTSGGLVYYHAATHTLHAPGQAEFTHPEGGLNCADGLCVVLSPSAEQAKPGKGFMSQFSGLRFDGISTATAKGQVVMTGVAAENREALRAEADTLTYNGKTGECSLLGGKCRLTYGGYDVYTDEGLHLLANGDIELRGSNIHGNYERDSEQAGQRIKGTFKANAPVIFRAELGTISTEKGLSLADAEAAFSCDGPAHLVLTPREGTTVPEQKPGMPNLAIARYGNVSRAHASGNVVAHRYAPGTGACISELKAQSVETDLVSGETLLLGVVGEPLIAKHEQNSIEAVPAAGEAASIQILANGDLKLNGDRITTTLVNKDGTRTTACCRDYVRLIRAEDRLETGSSTEVNAPTAILTTKGSLNARLATTGTPGPRKQGLAGLSFNYNGIREATTQQGCTLRTEQGSMQCTGPVRIEMAEETRQTDSALGALKHATAAENVIIAGKDNTGRLLRASGDLLTIDATTGMKVLTGNRVTVGDAHNTHVITGNDAAIRIDAHNNVSISGSNHTTHATNVRQQLNNQNNKNTKK